MKKTLMIVLLCAPSVLFGASSAPFLRFNYNAASQGMGGGEGCARFGDISGMSINPASTNGASNASAAFSYGNIGEFDISATQTSVLVPVADAGSFGASFIYSKQVIDDPANPGSKLDRNDRLALLNYSFMSGDSLGFGLNLKYSCSDVEGTTASFLAADIGALYLFDKDISFGLAAKDIGVLVSSGGSGYGLKDESLDSSLLAGVNYYLLDDNESKLSLSMDLGFVVPFDRAVISAGMEYGYNSLFVIRLGDYENMSGENYLSVGLGMDTDIAGINFKFDYTYSPKISGSYNFSNDQFITITSIF